MAMDTTATWAPNPLLDLLFRDEELLARLLERLPVMITFCDRNLGTFRFNAEFKRTLGWTEEDAASGDLMALAYPDPVVREEASRYMASLAPGWREFLVTAKDGTVVPSTWANIRLRDDIQVGIGLDLREHKRSETALREEERKYRALFESSLDAVYVTRHDGAIIDANRAACRMHEMTVEEIKERGRAGLVVSDERLAAALKVRAATGQTKAELDHIRKDGTTFPVEIQSVIIDPSRGDWTTFVIARDVSERRRADEAVRDALARSERNAAELEAIVQAIPHAVYFGDANGITRCNDEGLRMLGAASVDDLSARIGELGTRFAVRYRPDGGLVEAENLPFARALRGETATLDAWVTKATTGDDALVRGNSAPVVVAGKVIGAVAVSIDITDQYRAREALRDSQEKLQAAFAGAAIGFAITTPDGRFLDANPAYSAITGYGVDELRGLAFPAIVHPDDVATNTENTARMLAGEVPGFVIENRYIRKDGSAVWVRKSVSVVRAPSGKPLWNIALIEDVTDRRAAEEALRESEERFRVLVDHAADAFFLHDFDGRMRDVNPRACENLGYTREELLGMTVPEIEQDFDLPAAKRLWAKFQVGEHFSLLGHHRRKDGTVFPVEVNASCVRVGGERLLIGLARDITERKRAEEALRRTEAVLQYAGAMAHLGAWWIDIARHDDLHANPLRWSDEVYRIFGYEPGEVEVSNALFFEHVHPEDRQRVADAIAQALAMKQRYVIEHRILPRAGSERVVLEYGSFEFDDSGRPTRIVGAVQDVTERRRAEDALREADRRKDEFLGMLSHELRNPLAPIRSSTYILGHAQAGSEQARRAQTVIERQTEHLTRLVDDLLDVTRIARRKIDLRRSCVDLRDVVMHAADDYHVLMSDRGVRFHLKLPTATLLVDGDPTRLSQILGNLLHNAAKFTRWGDEVTLSLAAVDGTAEIRVSDTGVGIEPTLLPNVFDAFVQGEKSLARTSGGLGLGLALVKEIAELHSGSVRAESAGTDRGTEFIVRLPLTPRVVVPVPSGAAAAQERNGRARTVPSARRRVLVVDDNVDGANALAEVVEMLGHAAEVVYDGPSAIEKARATHHDFVLCDIGLPGMSGYEVAQALRAQGPNGRRVVAISGYARAEDLQRAAEAGFDNHIAKPCDPEHIRKLLE
jgi:PAS domain S-box-containing protein